jgi:hypothetical protein
MAKIIYNDSEAQLYWFLQGNYKLKIELSLRPQGDNTIILKEAVNLCEVKIEDKTYFFGGIREHIYDNFAMLYDHREKCEHSFISNHNEAPYGSDVCRLCGMIDE